MQAFLQTMHFLGVVIDEMIINSCEESILVKRETVCLCFSYFVGVVVFWVILRLTSVQYMTVAIALAIVMNGCSF